MIASDIKSAFECSFVHAKPPPHIPWTHDNPWSYCHGSTHSRMAQGRRLWLHQAFRWQFGEPTRVEFNLREIFLEIQPICEKIIENIMNHLSQLTGKRTSRHLEQGCLGWSQIFGFHESPLPSNFGANFPWGGDLFCHVSQLRQVEGRSEATGFWCVEVAGGVEIGRNIPPDVCLKRKEYKEELDVKNQWVFPGGQGATICQGL